MSGVLSRMVEASTGMAQGQKTKAELTIEFLESRLTSRRWCAYHGTFQDLDDFSNAQRMKNPDNRFCLEFTNAHRRQNATPTTDIDDAELRRVAKILKIKVTDLEEVPEERPSRPSRSAGGTSSSTALVVTEDPPRDRRPAEIAKPPKKRKAAAPPSNWDPKKIDEYMMEMLRETACWDANNTLDETERDFKGRLLAYTEFDADLDFQVALDDVRRSDRTHTCVFRRACAMSDVC